MTTISDGGLHAAVLSTDRIPAAKTADPSDKGYHSIATLLAYVQANISGGGDLLSTNNLSDLANAATARTNLGLSANGSSLVTAANYAAMRALLDLEAGTDFYSKSAADAAFQPLDSDLTAIAALSTTSYGRALLALADLAALRTVLGPSGTPSSSTFLRGDGQWATPAGGGGGDLLASNNLSDVADASTARTNLGLAIGTNVQAYDADLTTWAGLTPSANAQSLVTAANYAAMRALLDLEAGTDFYSKTAADAAFQPLAALLTSWAAITRASGFDTFAATPSSANLRSLLTDETGTGAAVFATSPTLVTPALGTPASGTLTNCTGLPAAGISGLAAEVVANISGGGSAITTGVKGYIVVPYAMTITSATILADTSGAIVIDVWKDTYANFPPTDADSITSSAPPTISASGVKSQDSTLTGWTTSVSAGEILGFNVDSCSSITQATLILRGTRT